MWATNLHESDVELLLKGSLEDDGGTTTPFDLIRMLNEPFSSITALAVPPLTNALLTVCGGVIRVFAALQRRFVRSLATAALTEKMAGQTDATLRMRATCACMRNSDRAKALLEQREYHPTP